MTDIEETLCNRHRSYGDYITHSKCKDLIQAEFVKLFGWSLALPEQRQAAMAIVDKLIRCFNGEGYLNVDNWHDIQGYAKLVENSINRNYKDATINNELPF